MSVNPPVLIVGELFVDYTLGRNEVGSKMRLGGVAHAARGLWSANVEYAVAAFCPSYLVDEARRYLGSCECKEFVWLGDVVGAPNVIFLKDATELADQGYEELMRESKEVQIHEQLPSLDLYERVVFFPGQFNISSILHLFSSAAIFSFDIAYDFDDFSLFKVIPGKIGAIVISTSSLLFMRLGERIETLIAEVQQHQPEVFLLKENRGGSRLFDLKSGEVEEIPANLGETVNSVGVGDVYSAVMVALSAMLGWKGAAWRGYQAATVYARSTFPDDIKRDIQREFCLPLKDVQAMGGVFVPWHDRQNYSIYLAGPDFSFMEKAELEYAVESLTYHNFKVRRPIVENGELLRPASEYDLQRTYHMDYQLLKECDLVFAIPLGRDPGTLIEMGMAIEMGKPLITYDPRKENNNTMVMIGSQVYSFDLGECLNGVFKAVSKIRMTA